ncbi:MAG: hypothetical protein JO099_09895 [Acidobacteriia bacterium]|nr:hypothetical protein [Terriglobia bacterium]
MYKGVESPHALINAETAVSLSFLLVLYVRSGTLTKNSHATETYRSSLPGAGRHAWNLLILFSVLLLVVAASYARILTSPFLFDDYTHIADASRSDFHALLRLFGPDEHKPGLFFRPVGFLLYRLNFLWAGGRVEYWHAGSIVLHATDSWLVFVLCRNLEFAKSHSVCAGLIFAINPGAAEPVAWIDAGFDLIATGFVLVALIFTSRYLASGSRRLLGVALGAAAAALLSKESAFCLPALLVSIYFLRPKSSRRYLIVAFVLIAALCAAIFVYRWWAIGGIGGYEVRGTGIVGFLRYNFLNRLNGVLLRQWAILFFPINWSVAVNRALRIVLVAIPWLYLAAALAGKLTRRQVFGCVSFTLLAAVPAQKMLLIGPDLSGSRVLYLPGVGMALLWGILLGGLTPRLRAALTVAVLAAGVLILEHNLRPWREVPELARSACASLATKIAAVPGPITVESLPATKFGAVFLANGFPQCVQMYTGISADAIHVRNTPEGPVPPNTFLWDDRLGWTAEHGSGRK